MTQDTTPTSGADDLRTAAQAVVDRWDTPLWKDVPATAEYIGRLRAALAAGQATAAPAEPDPTPGDHPQPCDSELFESGVSVGLFDIPKWTAEALCKGIAAATGARVDWHYIGGRVHVKALPAPTSAEGAAYAALPDEGEPWRGHKFKEVQRGCWRCDCGKTIKEVTSDQSTPASGGNYPVMPKRYTVDDDGEELFTAEKMRAFADATHALRASHGQAPAAVPDDFLSHKLAWREAIAQCGLAVSADDPDRSYWEHELRAFDRAYSELASITPQADRVQEDAALWHWLAEYLVGPRTDLDDEIVASETVNDLRKLVKAAIKQGEKQ